MKYFDEYFHKGREEPAEPREAVIKGRFEISKDLTDDDRMQAFGWANIAVEENGNQIDDYQNDLIDPEDLEAAAYDFVKFFRDAGEMHQRNGVGTLIESVFFSKAKQKALGIPEGTLPEGWFVGFQVTDPDVWKKVKTGEYQMFSIEGTAERVDVGDVSRTR